MAGWQLAVAAAVPGSILFLLLTLSAYLGYKVYRKYRNYAINDHERPGGDDVMVSEFSGMRRSFVNQLTTVPEDDLLPDQARYDRHHRMSGRSMSYFGSSVRSQVKSPRDTFGASVESAGVWL